MQRDEASERDRFLEIGGDSAWDFEDELLAGRCGLLRHGPAVICQPVKCSVINKFSQYKRYFNTRRVASG